jgi:hypothetical protein
MSQFDFTVSVDLDALSEEFEELGKVELEDSRIDSETIESLKKIKQRTPTNTIKLNTKMADANILKFRE